jgi:hypothetical protein
MLDFQGFTCVAESAVVTKSVMKAEKAKQAQDAGAPEIEVTPEMIEAGERTIFAFGVRPDLSTAGWAASLAEQVYQAMEREAQTMRIQSRSHSRGE